MRIVINMPKEDEKLIRDYAKAHNENVSKFMCKIVLEKIENEYDIKCANKALMEYKKELRSYTLEEIEKELKIK